MADRVRKISCCYVMVPNRAGRRLATVVLDRPQESPSEGR